MKQLLVLISFTFCQLQFAQQTFQFQVKDSVTSENIPGAKIVLKGTVNLGGVTDLSGLLVVPNIQSGEYEITASASGYESKSITISFPTKQQEPYIFYLASHEHLDEIIIEGTRSNKSISDTPTRTEALTEEIDEAASMEPSKVSHLLTHTTGIQVQTTSASSNGSVIRIQGLNGRYTQLLRDGFPLYGGFSGSLDIMQIPPLDLRQVEFIKGPASTLYGGGAIGGIVNLLSKTADKDETLLHFNFSNIGASDFNSFVARDLGKIGFTNLASFHYHLPYDADGDGYTDIAQVSKMVFNPKLYFQPNNNWKMYAGFSFMQDQRKGGDVNLINDKPITFSDFYLDQQESRRITTQLKVNYRFTSKSSFEIKNSFSQYRRYISVRENMLDVSKFKGTQMNSYSEATYSYNSGKHNLITGFNFILDDFKEDVFTTDTSRNQMTQTLGYFLNYILDVSKKWSVEAGFRGDLVNATSSISSIKNQFFALPRLNTIYKLTKGITLRLGGGFGYRMPTIFNEESEPLAFKNIKTINYAQTKSEQSMGGNFDIKYLTNFNSENLLFSFNQMFYYNIVENPIYLIQTNIDELQYLNYGERVHSRGFETQVKFTFYKFTWFLGYTFNQAFLETSTNNTWLTLIPQHSIKGDILFVEENKWRIGLDYEYKSGQWLSNAVFTQGFFTSGIVIERTLGNFVLFFNAENYTDVRQSRYQTMISAPNNTPQNTEIWAPLDGRFFNAGIKIKL